MMTTGESGQQRSKQLHCLVFAESDHQHGIAQNFLAGHGESPTKLDEAASVQELLNKLEQKPYDLLLIAHDVSEPQAAEVVEELKRRGKRVPLLFLPESLVGKSAPRQMLKDDSKSKAQQKYSETWLSRTVRSAALFASAEQQGRQAEDTVRTLYRAMEQAADLVVITDNAGTIEYVNPAFEKLTGYSRAEAIGQTPRILKSGEQSAELYRDLWRTIRVGEIFRGVLVNRKKSGESFIVEKTITPVRNTRRADRTFHFQRSGHQRAEAAGIGAVSGAENGCDRATGGGCSP